jgi:SAM-dependent methyltransferase
MSDPCCRICGSSALELAWDLAQAPYGDLFCESREAAQKLPSLGLTLVLCQDCELLQVTQEVDVEVIYLEYLYQSSVTVGLGEYYQRLTKSLVLDLELGPSDLVVDVGSNDGTGLKPYRDAGMQVLGIEPSRRPAFVSMDAGIPTINSFLDENSVSLALSQHGVAKLVCANYVAANVPNPVAFFENMRAMLAPDGVISVVTGYHPDQFAVNMFDYINHDHLSYFSVTSAVRLAQASGLMLTGAERVEHKGGSIHLLFRAAESKVTPDESITKLIQREKWLGIDVLATYAALAARVDMASHDVHKLLGAMPNSAVAGVGASISTTHLLHQFGIGSRVARLFDDDANKIGRFSPGFGIEVSPLKDLGEKKWQFALLLAWQHSDVLLSRMQSVGFTGSVIVPLPNPHIVHLGSA